MNVDGNEQGYKYSRLWLNNYLQTIDKWDMEAYLRRYEIISERFLKVWEYPKVQLEEIPEEEEQNIFDAEEPTFKKLDYFIFDNTKVETDAVAQMYMYVIKELFERNSQLLTNGQGILKITKEPGDFRSPQEVSNGWYIETNIDSNSKFGYLKKLLSIYEMEDDLIIKYGVGSDSTQSPNRLAVRKDYWQQLLPELKNTSLFSNVNPSRAYWLSAGAGVAGITYTMQIALTFVRVELTISSSSKELNKRYFRRLLENRKDIENAFGGSLEWEELSDNKMSRIKIEEKDKSLNNPANWGSMNQFFIDTLPRFENALKPFVSKLK
jgi:hypothetical protein